jgi:exodeoxyribonuclease V alpha subunit
MELRENFRFAERPGIQALAEAVREPELGALLKASPFPREGQAADVEGLRSPQVDAALARIWPEVLALASAQDPVSALKALNGQRVLCAVNDGTWGVDGLNRRIERKLQDWARTEGRVDWCRPVMVLVNDPHTGLSNGELGVLMPGPDGGRACFDQGGEPKGLARSRLPAHETAWAMSVHRSQGSEYGTVLVVLPPGGSSTDKVRGLLSPELLYTAVTRAVRRVVLCADEAALRVVCWPRESRVTGLSRWLA